MHKEVGWYLVELERILSGKLPRDRVDGLISEVEAHLTDATDALTESGDPEPGVRAVREFGSIRRFASQVLESSASPMDRKGWGVIAAFAGVWLCVIPIWIMLQSDRRGFEPMPPLYVMAGGGILVAALAIWRSRSPLFGSLLAGSAIGAISLTGFAVFGMLDMGEPDGHVVLPRTGVDGQAQKWQSDLQKLRELEQDFNEVKARYLAGTDKIAEYIDEHGPGEYRVPILLTEDSPGKFRLEEAVETRLTRVRARLRNGGAQRYLENAIQWREMLLNSLPAAKSRTIGQQLRSFGPQTFGWSGACLVVLWILGIVVDTVRRSLQLRPKRWALH